MNELFETKMVKAGATTGRVAFVLTTIKFKEAYREEEGGPVAEAGAVMVSVGACVRVKEKNRLIRVDQIDEKKGTFRGVRIITRNECRNEWVGKFIDVCPKQGLKPSEIKRMSDKEANEYEVFVTEDDSGWIDISDVVEVMNARHHLVQPPKKKSLEDNVFETRVATMKFMNAGATGKKGTELEAKIFRTKKVTCLSTFTRDEKTIASERKRVMDSVAALFEENGDAKKSAKKKTLAAGAADYKTPSTQKKQKSPTPAKKKGARVKEEEEEEEGFAFRLSSERKRSAANKKRKQQQLKNVASTITLKKKPRVKIETTYPDKPLTTFAAVKLTFDSRESLDRAKLKVQSRESTLSVTFDDDDQNKDDEDDEDLRREGAGNTNIKTKSTRQTEFPFFIDVEKIREIETEEFLGGEKSRENGDSAGETVWRDPLTLTIKIPFILTSTL
mmetsp:Transcript_617/g.1774  ORF Transcript_617/g.1774 Transcript_617/m.1774 type:complete len:445 (-) Transcript_617:107-1441(-)